MGQESAEMSEKYPEQLQRDIRHTEAELTATIDEIEERLSPRRLQEEVRMRVQHYFSSSVDNVRETIRRNPVPAAVIGVAVLVFAASAIARRRGANR